MSVVQPEQTPAPDRNPSCPRHESRVALLQQGVKASRLSVEWGWAALATPRQCHQAERRLQTSLRQLGRVALDAAFNDSTVDELQAITQKKYVAWQDMKSAIGEIEGAAMPDDPQHRAREEHERRAKTVDLRRQLSRAEQELDDQLIELGQAVFGGSSSHPAVDKSVQECQAIQTDLDELVEWKTRLCSDWRALPKAARLLGIGWDTIILLGIGLLSWALLGTTNQPNGLSVRRINSTEVVQTAELTSNLDEALLEDPVSGIESTTTTTEESSEITDDSSADERSQSDSKLPAADLPSAQFTGKIRTSTDRPLHQFIVPPALATVLVDRTVHHLGDDIDSIWPQPDP